MSAAVAHAGRVVSRRALALIALGGLQVIVAASASAQLVRTRTGTTSTTATPVLTTEKVGLTPVPIAEGPPPTGLTTVAVGIVTGTVSWQPVAGAVGYSVQRWLQSSPDCCRATSPQLTTTTWSDAGLEWPGTYVYRVYVNYGDGRQGYADVTHLRPEPQNATGLDARQTGEGEVTLTWTAAPGVTKYFVAGPGAGPSGYTAVGTTAVLRGVPAGQHEWAVGTLYEPGGLLTQAATWPRKSLNVVSMTGRYAISVIGFQVSEATPDDWWSWDGKGDEVYPAYHVSVFNRQTGALLFRAHGNTLVHGDVNNLPNRIQAGTFSAAGGLQASDAFPAGNPYGSAGASTAGTQSLPLLVFNGQLTNSLEMVLIAPAIWESDRNDTPYQTWWQVMDTVAVTLAKSQPILDDMASSQIRPFVGRELAGIGITMDNKRDRPLGMRPAGNDAWVQQRVVVLTREKIEAALTSQFGGGLPVGIIAVPLTDVPSGYHGTGGSYTMYLKVERK